MFDEDFKNKLIKFQDLALKRASRLGADFASNLTGFRDDAVDFEGDEYWSYGGHEHHYYSFEWKFFLCSDGEFEVLLHQLQQSRINELKLKEEAKMKEEEERARLKESVDYQIYLKLREKFNSV